MTLLFQGFKFWTLKILAFESLILRVVTCSDFPEAGNTLTYKTERHSAQTVKQQGTLRVLTAEPLQIADCD